MFTVPSVTRSPVLRYGIAVAAVALALLAARLLETPGEDHLLLLLLAAVVLSAWLGGFGPVLLATALSALAHSALRRPPASVLVEPTWEHGWALGVFLVLSVFVAVLEAARERTARDREHLLAQLQASLQEKDTLLREIHHRVKNNLQVISSLLSLQGEATPDPRVQAVVQVSQDRIQTMALIHDHLYRSDTLARVNLAPYLATVASHLRQVYCPEPSRVALHAAFAELWVDLDTAIPCGLILNELLTNCCKHAFPGGRAGAIHLELQATSAQEITLTVRDTGIGLPDGLEVQTSASLGWQLVQLLTEQLGGTLALTRGGGTTITLRFPASPAGTRQTPAEVRRSR
jgi:two-component sensor histidine kinase